MTNHEIETIKKIESLGGKYDPDSGLSMEDQLLACEAVKESTPIKEEKTISQETGYWVNGSMLNGNVYGSVNGACYSPVNPLLVPNYSEGIQKLSRCSSETAPKEIAAILETVFGPAKEGHWLYCAQHWNPRQILWVLNDLKKQTDRQDVTIWKSYAAYFTFLLKKRKLKSQYTRRMAKQAKGVEDFQCFACKSKEYWQRYDCEKVCSICHPKY